MFYTQLQHQRIKSFWVSTKIRTNVSQEYKSLPFSHSLFLNNVFIDFSTLCTFSLCEGLKIVAATKTPISLTTFRQKITRACIHVQLLNQFNPSLCNDPLLLYIYPEYITLDNKFCNSNGTDLLHLRKIKF